MSPSPRRRQLLQATAGLGLPTLSLGAPPGPSSQGADAAPPIQRGRALRFPQDFGAHPASRTEWWYITGSLSWAGAARQPALGFQITFFRSRVDVAAHSPSRFAVRQLIMAHVALTDLGQGQLLHEQRIARSGFGLAQAQEGDTRLALRDWTLQRSGPATRSQYRSRIVARAFSLDLLCTQTQPLLLQGEAGFSRKGPQEAQASHYYSQPQLQVQGRVRHRQQDLAVQGLAWMDHEWSESLLDPQAVGWDWVGMNLQDGSALTAFRLRRQDGSTLYSGGSLRRAGEPARILRDGELQWAALRHWASPATGARYPVAWQIDLPGARYTVRALIDNQELDSRASVGSVYWEGLSSLHDAQGRQVGSGYLEMTGYVKPMQL